MVSSDYTILSPACPRFETGKGGSVWLVSFHEGVIHKLLDKSPASFQVHSAKRQDCCPIHTGQPKKLKRLQGSWAGSEL